MQIKERLFLLRRRIRIAIWRLGNHFNKFYNFYGKNRVLYIHTGMQQPRLSWLWWDGAWKWSMNFCKSTQEHDWEDRYNMYSIRFLFFDAFLKVYLPDD